MIMGLMIVLSLDEDDNVMISGTTIPMPDDHRHRRRGQRRRLECLSL
jgi:hypothetical protein